MSAKCNSGALGRSVETEDGSAAAVTVGGGNQRAGGAEPLGICSRQLSAARGCKECLLSAVEVPETSGKRGTYETFQA